MPHEHALAQSDCRSCRSAFRAAVLRSSSTTHRALPWRRSTRSAYELVIAEVLLQQTRAETVAAVFETILLRCPDWSQLATISIGALEGLLRPLGLQHRRAVTLHELATAVRDRGGLPTVATEIEALPGLGQYMARAIAAQLSGERVAPIDVNIARVLERVFGARQLADVRHDPYLQNLALQLVPAGDPGGYLMAMLDFAAAICRAREPRCDRCPVLRCRYASENQTR